LAFLSVLSSLNSTAKYENVKIMYYCKKKSLTSTDSPLALTLITNKDKVSLNLCSCFFHFNEYYENLENLIKDNLNNVYPNVIVTERPDKTSTLLLGRKSCYFSKWFSICCNCSCNFNRLFYFWRRYKFKLFLFKLFKSY